ncbi:PD-(D/E)XK nuclease family protein [Pontibacter ruber]|uniref:PD-(D/E)XK nuclease family protein n=1 Tax=Pontibacter ruber TaxID=1343895 RepID=A0ABW5CX66_9BACT|nr:PD-(D/E)XK nuclease family protein [Pontibacter ruber]
MSTPAELEQLIDEFSSLPKFVQQPTYLELCQYPYRRFEEICSKLLSFYLQPTNEHGLNDLFINCLTQLVQGYSSLQYRSDQLQIIVEDNADGKRIDIVIVGENFVIGIENKIDASLYNPLDIYRKKLESYKKESVVGVVLTLRKIQRKSEVDWMKANGFTNITYSDLFNSVKQNIGFYLNQSSDKYFIYLKDFMATMENMEGSNILNQPLSDFFFDNSDKIDELVHLYEEFNNRIVQIQNQHISSLQEAISDRTGHKWWVWGGFDLGCSFTINNHKIGIETHFKRAKRNPIGKYIIQITTWNIKDWNYFREKVVSLLPNCAYETSNGRAFLTFDVLINPDEDQIVDKLEEVFHIVQKVIRHELSLQS